MIREDPPARDGKWRRIAREVVDLDDWHRVDWFTSYHSAAYGVRRLRQEGCEARVGRISEREYGVWARSAK